MKRFLSLFFVFVLLCCFALVGCDGGKVDYSGYDFTDIRWEREGDHDTETIRFGSDGSFSYSCACGNPVNDSDLCEGYTYNDESKTITLNYIESSEDAVTVIVIEKIEGDKIYLDFNGEIRVFEK